MGMTEDMPLETEVTVAITDLGDWAAMILTHAGVPADSGAGAGWAQAFDKMARQIGQRTMSQRCRPSMQRRSPSQEAAAISTLATFRTASSTETSALTRAKC
jgi:hypothetical protein